MKTSNNPNAPAQTETANGGSVQRVVRPPIIHLGGNATKCCGCFVLIDCDGIYKCACGRKQEAKAQSIIREMAV